MKVLVTDFSGVYRESGFLLWLKKEAGEGLTIVDYTRLEGTCCYCTAQEKIFSELPSRLPVVRWIDSGDYHYMSHLLARREKEPFHLLLLDHHPDNQDPVFEGVLSCGAWVKAMQEENPLLQSVLSVGPEGCPEDIPETWLRERRGERLYVSLDKDIMDRPWARTDWTQGAYTLPQVKEMLRRAMEGGMQVAAVDICGELPVFKGGCGEDLRINFETNKELYKHITTLLNQ